MRNVVEENKTSFTTLNNRFVVYAHSFDKSLGFYYEMLYFKTSITFIHEIYMLSDNTLIYNINSLYKDINNINIKYY